MANSEHMKILAQGVEVWNKWRDENPDIIPDLSRAELNNKNFNTVNFSKTNLIHSDLKWTYLVGADLSYAKLRWAELTWANLTGSILFGANLELSNLIRANLTSANFSYADLNQTLFRETIFSFTLLRNSKNLESCLYFGPNIIDLRTIKVSWPLPKEFLRGCGLSDEYIEILPSLVQKTVQFYSCYISHSHKDEEFAKRLHADLQDKGIRCWFAPEDMKIGDKIRPGIDEAIRIYDKLLLILSENSINSEWVEKEVETAFEKERKEKKTVLFPIRLDDSVMEADQAWAADIRTRHIGDFRDWKNHDKYQKAFERLLRDLKAEKGG